MRTSPGGWRTCGGIFDFEEKEKRLAEVSRLLEDPAVWNDTQRAQELGRERKSLAGVVETLSSVDQGLRDSLELFGMARADNDDATLEGIE